MTDIIWYTTMLLTASLFKLIGDYAQRREKPMWFWAGSEVDAATITDVKKYNAANALMWKCYALWYMAAGVAWSWSHAVALAFLIGGGTVGTAILVGTYLKIEKKYTKK